MIMNLLFRRIELHRTPPQWASLLVLAENDFGDLLLPSLDRPDWWDRPFDPRRPAHWPYLVLSAVTGWVVMVEAE